MTTAQLRTLFLMLIVVGAGFVLIGVLAKIKGWPAANVFIPIGMIAEIVAAIGSVMVMLRMRRGR